MPKFYCDYCQVFLSHSSPGGRKQHCKGKKHIQKKIQYYQQFLYEFQNSTQRKSQKQSIATSMGQGGGPMFDYVPQPLMHPPPLLDPSQGGAIKPVQPMSYPTFSNQDLNHVESHNFREAYPPPQKLGASGVMPPPSIGHHSRQFADRN